MSISYAAPTSIASENGALSTPSANGEKKSNDNIDIKPSLGGAASWGLPTKVKMEMPESNSQDDDKKDIKLTASVPVVQHLRGSLPLLEQSGDVIVGKDNAEAKMLGIGLPKLRSFEKDAVEKAKRFAMEQSVKVIMLRHATKHQENQQKIAMYANALSMMSKVYCGNVSLDVREDQIRSMFSPFGPVKQINVSYDQATGMHKGFAFVEFEVPEAAELALHQMNGALCSGKILKCSKIDGIIHGLQGAEPIIKQITMEARQHYRVYVASIHPDLNETDIKEVFMAFGTILDCTLATHSANKHRGYGYITFERVQSANEAVASMNMFDLGGMHLRVIRAITPPSAQVFTLPTEAQKLPTASAIAAASVTAKIVTLDSTNQALSQANATSATQGVAPFSPLSKTASAVNISSAEESGPLAITNSPSTSSLPAVSSLYQASPAIAVATPPTTESPQHNSGRQSPNIGNNSPARRSKFGEKVADVAPPSFVDNVPVAQPRASFDTPSSEAASAAQAQNAAMATSSSTASLPAEAMAEMEAMAAAFQQVAAAEERAEEDAKKSAEEKTQTNKKDEDIKKDEPKGDKDSSSRQSKKKRKRNKNNDDREDDRKRRDDGYRGDRRDDRRGDRYDRRGEDRGRGRDDRGGDRNSNRPQGGDDGGGGGSIYAQEKAKLLKSKDQRTLLMQKLMKKNASNVVILRNMVDAADVDDDLQEEITEECGKYGIVNRVIICQERFGEADQDITVKIFVQFIQPAEAEKAVIALDGRYFGGKTIKAEIYDQKLFECGDYTN